MQCGQTDLRSADADCDRQVLVRCHDPDAVCFTRQILLGGGMDKSANNSSTIYSLYLLLQNTLEVLWVSK